MEDDALESPSKNAPVDTYMLGFSLSHDQLINIIHLSSNWANAGSKDKDPHYEKILEGPTRCRKMQMVVYVWWSRNSSSDPIRWCFSLPYHMQSSLPALHHGPHFDPEPHKWIDKLVKWAAKMDLERCICWGRDPFLQIPQTIKWVHVLLKVVVHSH